MPVKDLVGRPRPTPAQKALEKELFARMDAMRRRRRGDPGDEDPQPATPPSGPSPTPLAGGAELDLE